MTLFLLEHLKGCTPLSPCLSCKAAEFLRRKLPEEDYAELVKMAGSLSTTEWPYSKANPAPLTESIDVLQLTARSHNALKNSGYATLADLVKESERVLLRTPNIGKASIKEIRDRLEAVGRSLAVLPANP